MAASPTPRPKPAEAAPAVSASSEPNPALLVNPALAPLSQFLRGESPTSRLAVAYSGGPDSTALLRAACDLAPGRVIALHVHHGLQSAAADFQQECEATAQALSVPLQVLRVQAQSAPGQSPEDAARVARYAALAAAAGQSGCGLVLLGQHADDQAETVLLALGRGAGLPGLAAMPARFERHGQRFARPLLATPGAALRHWLQARGYSFVEDPSNSQERYTRSRLRGRLMPALAQALPQFRDTFARSARHAAQAQQLLEELAQHDLEQLGRPPRLAPLQALSSARQANALRHWLAADHGARPSEAQLTELLRQVAACRTRGHRIELKVAGGCVSREGDRLVFARR